MKRRCRVLETASGYQFGCYLYFGSFVSAGRPQRPKTFLSPRGGHEATQKAGGSLWMSFEEARH